MADAKRCCKCGEVKSAVDFKPDPRLQDGLKSRCKSCVSAYRKAYRQGVRDPVSKLSDAERRKRKAEYSKIYRASLDRSKARAYEKAWCKANPEKVAAKAQKYYAANREVELEKDRLFRLENGDVLRERERERYAKNAATILLRKRKARQANRAKELERYKRYRKDNPDIIRQQWKVRNARRRAAGPGFTRSDVVDLLKRFKRRCAHPWCRAKLNAAYHIDHVIPIALGGANDKYNIQPLCPPCNLRKHAKHPVDFAQQNGMLL